MWWPLLRVILLVAVLLILGTVLVLPWLKKKDDATRAAPGGTGVNEDTRDSGVGDDRQPRKPY